MGWGRARSVVRMLAWHAQGPGFIPSMAEARCDGAHLSEARCGGAHLSYQHHAGGHRSNTLSHTQNSGP